MFADTKERDNRLGEKAGYLSGYLLFTAMAFIILTATGKLPHNWSYPEIMGVTFIVSAAGSFLKRWLQ